MKKLTLLLMLFLVFACKEKSVKVLPNVDVRLISGDFNKWWNYNNTDIDLNSDYLAYDELAKKIEKQQFLEKLTDGKFIPIKLKKANTQLNSYQLFEHSNPAINKIIKRVAIAELSYFKRMGSKFPDYKLIDLEGKNITSQNTKGKHVVFSTWYMKDENCVNEFPELNELIKSYPNQDSLVFISLTFDKKLRLQEFLKKNPLNSKIISVSMAFIEDTLNLKQYPSHAIVDKNGNIERIFNDASKLKPYFKTHIK